MGGESSASSFYSIINIYIANGDCTPVPFNFAPAGPSETIVYGARRPKHPRLAPRSESVTDWIEFVKSQDIKRVCCLLDEQHLQEYNDLLGTYLSAFGSESVCHAPIPDFTMVDQPTFCGRILPFLNDADASGDPVVVHCSAGSGRTGQILALWLCTRRGYELDAAIESVEETGRNPLEAATLAHLSTIQCDPT